MAAQSATIEAGHVHLPKSNDWLGGFLHELLAFSVRPTRRSGRQRLAVPQWGGEAQVLPRVY